MKRPNFFIIGAPRCGTTSFYYFLREHPQCFMASDKEPVFFAPDIATSVWRDETHYLSLFRDADERHRAVGEATTSHLRSRIASESIYAFNPEAKIVVFLRDPIELVRSFHNMAVFNGSEKEPDFEKAWRRNAQQVEGTALAPMRDYRYIGLNGMHLARWLARFPREQVKVILYEEVQASIETVYRDLLAFLGCDDDGRKEFPRHNPFKSHRYPLLGRILQSKTVRRLSRLRKRLFGPYLAGMVAPMRRFNTLPTSPAPLSEAFHAELAAAFYKDVRLLERILGRDLGHWMRRKDG